MGVFDNMKDQIGGLVEENKDRIQSAVDQHGDKIGEGIDKAGDFVDDKTGGKYSEQVDTGQQKAKDALDALDGQDDDIA